MLHHFCPQHAGCIQLAAVCCAESCDGSVASLIGKQPVVEKKCPDTENSASSDIGAFFHCMVFGFKESRNVRVHEAKTCLNGISEQEETSNCEKKGVGPPDFNVKAVGGVQVLSILRPHFRQRKNRIVIFSFPQHQIQIIISQRTCFMSHIEKKFVDDDYLCV